MNKYIELGCSFTQEKYPDQKTLQQSISFILEELKLRKIRFSLRWNSIETQKEQISLEPYLEGLTKITSYNDSCITLNVGPIKTTDWPEVHIPHHILDSYPPLPRWPKEIPSTHPLVRKSGDYLHRLFQTLLKSLTKNQLSKIRTIQLNNEAFNPFGELLAVSSIDTELYFASIALHYFPNCTLLFNSAGKLQARKILTLMSKLPTQSILGIDYYYHTPTNDYPLIRNYNQLNLPLPWLPTMNRIRQTLLTQNNTLEFTEVQMEKWGHIEYPGYSLDSLKKTIRLLSSYIPSHQQSILLRLWGVELLSYSFITNSQSQKMVELKEFIENHNTIGI